MPIQITFSSIGRTINFVSRDLKKSFGHQEYYPFGSLNPFVDNGAVSVTLNHRADTHYEMFRIPYTFFEDANGDPFSSPQEVVDYILTQQAAGGFLDYNNAASSFETVADTWTDIPNDTLGAFTNLNYLPAGITDLIDESNGYLDFTQLSLGDQIIVRNDITVTPSINGTLLELRYLLGSGAEEYPLQVLAERLDVGSGVGYQRVTTFPIYMGDENTRLGPGRLQIRTSSITEVANAGSYINVIRR